MTRWARAVLLLASVALTTGLTSDGRAETSEARAVSSSGGRSVRPPPAKRGRAQGARHASVSHRPSRKASAKKRPSRATRGHGSKKRESTSRTLPTKWHAPPEPDDCPELDAAEPGSWGVLPIKTSECAVLPMIDPQSPEIAPEALERAATAFASKRNGSIHPVHPRLLQMLQRGVTHFNVPYVHLISGFRTGSAASQASRHAHGLAADVVFPGIPNAQVAAYMREQGFMGVGIYVKTGFVHLDVRERSYFWLDYSPPGKKWRGKPVRMKEAREADLAALERGEEPFLPPGEMQAALEARLAARARQRARRAKREAEKKKRAAEQTPASVVAGGP